MRKYLFFILIFLLSGCIRDTYPTTYTIEDSGEPANLTFTVDLSKINIAAPEVGTRATEEELAVVNNTEIHSLVLGVIKLDLENLPNSRMIGYRILIDDEKLGYDQKYFFKNVGNFHYRATEGSGLIPDIPLSSAGGIYAGGADDSTAEDSPYGLNGFVKEGGLNKYATFTFKYDYPLHGDIEKLTAGLYYGVLIANFTQSPSFCEGYTVGWWLSEEIAYWQRHKNDPNFDGIPYNGVQDNDAGHTNNDVYKFERQVDGEGNIVDVKTDEILHHGDGLNYFPGGKYLIYGRLLLNDARVTERHGTYDEMGMYQTSPNDVITSDSNIRNVSSDIIYTHNFNGIIRKGDNYHEAHLKILHPRVTFKIANHGSRPIQLSYFELSNNFSAGATHTLQNTFVGTTVNPSEPSWRGAPVVQSNKALVPFDSNTVYDPGDDEVFFDALTVETQDLENPLSFELKIKVPSIPVYSFERAPRLDNATVTGMIASEDWAVGTTKDFLLQSTKNISDYDGWNFFIKANETGYPSIDASSFGVGSSAMEESRVKAIVESVSASSIEMIDNSKLEHVWSFEKVNDTQIRIKNKAVGEYIKINTYNESAGTHIVYVPLAGDASLFTIDRRGASVDTNSVCFITLVGGKEVCLHVITSPRTGFTKGEIVGMGKWIENDLSSHFWLYPLNPTHSELTKVVNVPVKALNKENVLPEPLHTLNRNEHLTVLVNVAFNENAQDLEFEVKDWSKIENVVNFE